MNNLYFQDKYEAVYLYDNDVFIGSISYSLANDLFYISDFIIEEQYRRKGYGTKLVQYLLDNICTSDLELVVHCNEQSINIFKKLGFNEKEKYTILTK